MKYDPDIHHRQSYRLKGYDYSLGNFYYVTIRTNRKQKLFGEIANGKLIPNDASIMINDWLDELSRKFIYVTVNSRIIMPDHIHILIRIGKMTRNETAVTDEQSGRDNYAHQSMDVNTDVQGAQTSLMQGAHIGAPLHEIIQWFKTMTTHEYIRGVKSGKYLSFDTKVWQRDYFDRIIRNDEELYKIKEYIIRNPQNYKISHVAQLDDDVDV